MHGMHPVDICPSLGPLSALRGHPGPLRCVTRAPLLTGFRSILPTGGPHRDQRTQGREKPGYLSPVWPQADFLTGVASPLRLQPLLRRPARTPASTRRSQLPNSTFLSLSHQPQVVTVFCHGWISDFIIIPCLTNSCIYISLF